MRALRWVLIVVLALYLVTAAGPVAVTLAAKAGLYQPGDAAMRALIDATTVPILLIWVSAVVLYLLSLLFLVRRSRATLPALMLAWILDIGVVVLMQEKPAYDAMFDAGAQRLTWTLLAAVLLIALGVAVLERGRRRTNPTPRSPVALG